MKAALLAATAGIFASVLVIGPAYAGPPYRTDDAEIVEPQRIEMNLFSVGTKTMDGWSGTLPSFEVNYGALPNLQLHAIIPQGYAAPVDGRMGMGLGDLELGVKYRFLSPGDDDWFPQAAVFPLVEVPIGNQNMGFSTGHTQVFLPLWLQKEFDPWTIYGGGGYWINPGIGNKNYAFFGVVLIRKITEDLEVGLEVFHQTSPSDETPASTGFNVGMTYNFNENWHLLSSAGTGLQNRNRTNQFSYFLGVQLTF